jgi:hypothetical protein
MRRGYCVLLSLLGCLDWSIIEINIIWNNNRSSILLLILFSEFAVLPLLHLQHFLELLRNNIVIHPPVHHVLPEVAVGGQRVFLVKADVVVISVNVEQPLLSQYYKFGPSSKHLSHLTYNIAVGRPLWKAHYLSGIVFLGSEELSEIVRFVTAERTRTIVC